MPRKTNVTHILTQEKKRRAVELRKFGLTFIQIGAELGVTAQTAHHYVKTALEELPSENADQLRMIQMERLNAMLVALWPKAQAGDERSIDTGLRVMDKMDRLMGTESPQQVVHTGAVLHVGLDSEQYIEGLKRMSGFVDDQEYAALKPAPEESAESPDENVITISSAVVEVADDNDRD